MGKRNNTLSAAGLTITTGDLLYKGDLVGTYTTYSVNAADVNRNAKKRSNREKKAENGV